MSIAEKLTQIAENEQKVYEAGKKAEWSDFWDEFQENGNRTEYMNNALGGYSFSTKNFYPKYDIKVADGYRVMYAWSNPERHTMNLAERLRECGVRIILDNATRITGFFGYGCFTEVPEMDFTKVSGATDSVYTQCKYLVTIGKITCNENTAFSSCFTTNESLVNITFEGVIGKNIDFRSSPLSKASIENIVEHLSSTASGMTLTLGKTAVTNAFGSTTADEWTALIATKSNWTITLA